MLSFDPEEDQEEDEEEEEEEEEFDSALELPPSIVPDKGGKKKRLGRAYDVCEMNTLLVTFTTKVTHCHPLLSLLSGWRLKCSVHSWVYCELSNSVQGGLFILIGTKMCLYLWTHILFLK